jgi:predicted PurR-regulated permease PerM
MSGDSFFIEHKVSYLPLIITNINIIRPANCKDNCEFVINNDHHLLTGYIAGLCISFVFIIATLCFLYYHLTMPDEKKEKYFNKITIASIVILLLLFMAFGLFCTLINFDLKSRDDIDLTELNNAYKNSIDNNTSAHSKQELQEKFEQEKKNVMNSYTHTEQFDIVHYIWILILIIIIILGLCSICFFFIIDIDKLLNPPRFNFQREPLL